VVFQVDLSTDTVGRMKSLVVAILPAAALWLGAEQASAQSGLSPDQIDQISRTVVRVVGLEGGEEVVSGSGTVVDAGGRIYTNRHVVDGAEDFSIEVLENPNELPVSRYRARLFGYAMDVDFAVLQIDRDDRGAQISAGQIDMPALSSQSGDSRRGDGVFVFGYPTIGDGYLAFTEGTVTTIRNGTLNDARLPVWYQTDAQIAPGNSGGLAVNSRGEMVGIPTAVRTESSTGGRLGGILPVNAVRAALESGLETDVSRIGGATSVPVIEGGTLDFNNPPTYGSAELTAGFTPDPHTIEVVSGGQVDASYLGGECVGHAAEEPDVRLSWSGTSAQLRIFFNGAGAEDASLLVNLPDGSWFCNDDWAGLDPEVLLSDPPEGQYDIWVGSYQPGEYISGTLSISEYDAEAETPEIDSLLADAEAGVAAAQFNLGVMYDTGEGVPENDAEAVRWYRLAAEQRDAGAQLYLGVMYALGQGVPQDPVLAHMWFNLAASRSDGTVREESVNARDKIADMLTSDQLGEAQRLAREWDAAHQR